MDNLWTNVDNSSLVSAYKYDASAKELYVQFKSNGAKYVYYDVPRFLAEAIDSAEKPGKVINDQVIKAGKKYSKVSSGN